MKSTNHKVYKEGVLFFPDQEDCKLVQSSGLFYWWETHSTFRFVFTMLDANNQHYIVFTCPGYKCALYNFDRLTNYGFPKNYGFSMAQGGYYKKGGD